MRLPQAAPATTRSVLVADLRRTYRRGRLRVAYRTSRTHHLWRSRLHVIDAHAVAELMLTTPGPRSPGPTF